MSSNTPSIFSIYQSETSREGRPWIMNSTDGHSERLFSAESTCGCGSQPPTTAPTAEKLRPEGRMQRRHRFAEVIAARLRDARRGDERAWRWIELLLQSSGISAFPASFPPCDLNSSEALEEILAKTETKSSMNCTPHVAECQINFFSPSHETPDPFAMDLACIPYVSSKTGNLDTVFKGDTEIDRVIIGVHGTNSAQGKDCFADYYNITYALTHVNPDLAKRVAVICPQFQGGGEYPYTDCWPHVAKWALSDWASGLPSSNLGGVSSFDFLDGIIARAAFKYPNAKSFIVMGHSAGGQAVHRYALLDAGIGIWLWQARAARLRYLCYNPFFYTFMTPQRYVNGAKTQVFDCVNGSLATWGSNDWHWGYPVSASGYDSYPYGLSNLGTIAGRVPKATNIWKYWIPVMDANVDLADDADVLRYGYLQKDIYHFQATLDAWTGCPGQAIANEPVVQQGWTRTQRFNSFRNSFSELLSQSEWAEKRFVSVADIPHEPDCNVIFQTHSPGHIYPKAVSLAKIMGPLG